MSRYIERAENNARLLEVNLQLMLDFDSQSEATVRQHWAPVINSLEDQELFHEFYQEADGDSVVEFVTLSKRTPTRSTPASPAPVRMPAASGSRSPPRCGSISTAFICLSARTRRANSSARAATSSYQRILHGSFPVHRHHRRHDDPRRGLGFHPIGQIPRTRRLHLAHPRREIPHPPAQRRTRRRQRGHRAMEWPCCVRAVRWRRTANFT